MVFPPCWLEEGQYDSTTLFSIMTVVSIMIKTSMVMLGTLNKSSIMSMLSIMVVASELGMCVHIWVGI